MSFEDRLKATAAKELGLDLRIRGWSLKDIAADPRIARSINTVRNWSVQGFWTDRANRARAERGLRPLHRKLERDEKTGRLLRVGDA